MENDMIEISVQITPFSTYDIMIPRTIKPETYPEVMKRLKAIMGMIPKVEQEEGPNAPSILMSLGKEETEEVLRIYKQTSAEAFDEYLTEKYNITGRSRANITSLMGRMKKRLGGMKSAEQLHSSKKDGKV